MADGQTRLVREGALACAHRGGPHTAVIHRDAERRPSEPSPSARVRGRVACWLGADDASRMALVLAALRVFAGLIWLANLSWKLPPSFGRHDARGLLYSFRVAEHWAVIQPLRHLVRSVVIPHFTLFGWLVFSVELAAGVLLTFGVAPRIGALIGTGQALIIAALVAPAPKEWVFGYAMFVTLNALPLLAPTTARLSLRPTPWASSRRSA